MAEGSSTKKRRDKDGTSEAAGQCNVKLQRFGHGIVSEKTEEIKSRSKTERALQ